MSRPRLTIASLLVFIAALGVAIAALREATPVWDSVLFAVVVFTLLTGTLLAMLRTGRARAGWLGLALFGWAYLAGTHNPAVESRLPTTKLLMRAWSLRAPTTTATANAAILAGQVMPINTSVNMSWDLTTLSTAPYMAVSTATYPDLNYSNFVVFDPLMTSFMRIGHTLFTALLAVIGFLMARWLSRPDAGPAPSGPPRTASVGHDEADRPA